MTRRTDDTSGAAGGPMTRAPTRRAAGGGRRTADGGPMTRRADHVTQGGHARFMPSGGRTVTRRTDDRICHASKTRLEGRGRAFRVMATLPHKNFSRAICGHNVNSDTGWHGACMCHKFKRAWGGGPWGLFFGIYKARRFYCVIASSPLD